MKYEVVMNGIVIGWSELEAGDPPMGVAYGRMHPSASYRDLAPHAEIRVRPEGGSFFDPSGGAHIEDFSTDLGPDAIEVRVPGLDAAVYERHFPDHVKAYKNQFKKMSGAIVASTWALPNLPLPPPNLTTLARRS